ncbi:MAG: transcriptional regulator, partial [Phycisphaerae bacterium]
HRGRGAKRLLGGSHLDKLTAVRYVTARKAFVGRKPVTYLSATRTGRRAFEDHVAALRDIINPPDTANGLP